MIENEKSDFELLKEQIEIDIQSARKFFNNDLYHMSLRRYEEALKLFDRMTEDDQASLSALYSEMELQRAVNFLHIGNPQKVIKIGKKLQKFSGKKHSECDFELNQLLGSAYFIVRDYNKTIIMLEPIIKELEERSLTDSTPKSKLLIARYLKIVALSYCYLLSFSPGLEKLYEARDIFLEINALPQMAECDTILGEIALNFSENRTSRYHITTALSIFAKTGRSLKLAQNLWYQARLFFKEGNYEKSLSLYNHAKKICLKKNFYRPAFVIMLDLASVYANLGHINQANDIFLEADDLCSAMDEPYFSKIELRLRQFEIKARTNSLEETTREGFRELIRYLRDQNNSYMLHNAIINMLSFEARNGNPDLALELLHEVESFWLSIRGDIYPLSSLFQADIELSRNYPQQAEKVLLKALKNLSKQGWEEITMTINLMIAQIHARELKNPQLAHEHFQKAIEGCESDFWKYKAPFHRQILELFPDDPYIEYLKFLLSQRNKRQSLEIVERKLRFELVSALGSDLCHRILPSSLPMKLQQKWDSLMEISKRLQFLEGSIEFIRPYDFHHKVLFHENEEDFERNAWLKFFHLSQEEKLLKEREIYYERLKSVKNEIISEEDRWKNIFLSNSSIEKNFPTDDVALTNVVILMFIVHNNLCYLFMIYKGELLLSHTIQITRLKLQKLIAKYLEAVTKGRDIKRYSTPLWEYFLTPVLEKIPDKTEKILIIPHDILWQLPFHLLQRSGKCLWDNYIVEYTPSMQLYFHSFNIGKDRQRKQFKCLSLIIPGISEQLSDLANLEHLIRDSKEQDEITLISDSLSKKKFLGRVRNSNIVIVGSPFHLLQGFPTGSYFDLSPEEENYMSNRITLDDVLEQKFIKTDIVVFPNVQSRLHPLDKMNIYPIFYLAWLHAGVPTVIYSLWPSDPVAVSLFMQHFLKFKSKMSIAEAFQKASLTLRNSGQFVNERDWAPMTMVGYSGCIGKKTKKRLFFKKKRKSKL